MSEYLVMQGFSLKQAELLMDAMTEAEKELFKTRMDLGAEYALGKQIEDISNQYAANVQSSDSSSNDNSDGQASAGT